MTTLFRFIFPKIQNYNKILRNFSMMNSPIAQSQLIVISGPSGSGKSTLLKRLIEEFPDKFGFSVSHTTRQPRQGEIDGLNYHFVTREKMMEEIKQAKFIEWAEFSQNLYGTSIDAVKKVISSGKTCLLDIDMQGVISVKKSGMRARFLFIAPPSLAELESRLRLRNTETEQSLQRRLDACKAEMDYAKIPGNHDCILVNDDLEKAYTDFKAFILEKPEA